MSIREVVGLKEKFKKEKNLKFVLNESTSPRAKRNISQPKMITINSKQTVEVIGMIRLVEFSKIDARIYNYTFKVSNFL